MGRLVDVAVRHSESIIVGAGWTSV